VWTALLGLWGFLSDWLSQGHGRRQLERLSADAGESGTGWERGVEPAPLEKKDGFRVRSFVFFFLLSKLPPSSFV